jgi:arylsulfatase A-like enzyme
VGTFTGLGLGAVGQTAIALSRHPGSWEPSLAHRLVGTLLLSALYGLVLAIVAFGLLAVTRGRAPRLVVATASVLGATLVLLHSLGVALRLVTGSHLTLSGLEYFMNSGTHIANEVLNRFVPHLLCLAAIGAVVGWVLARGIRWALAAGDRPVSRVEHVGAVATGALSLGMLLAPVPQAFALGVKQTVPELAFAASFGGERARTRSLGVAGNALLARALDAPPQSRAATWRTVATTSGVRPNVILVTVEATNIHHLGYEGYERDTTPNLDKLAAGSLRFERAYTTATHSNYAQMAIISSLFPRRGSTLDMYFKLGYPRELLHDVMSELGYATATISSQDETWQGMKRFQDTGTPTYFFHSPDEKGPHLDIGTEEVVPDEVTIDHVLAHIDEERPKGKPLSIYVNLQATHFPYAIPDAAPHPFKPFEPKGVFNFVNWEESDREAVVNRYDNALHYIDAQMGKLAAGLEERGMLDDTILVFVADHGEMFREHDLVTHARSLYEGEARVPVLVHYPAGLEPGAVLTPVSTLDILPTVLDVMGVPPHPAMQGESVLPDRAAPGATLARALPARPAVFLNIQGWRHLEAVVCFPYKAIYDPVAETSQLFDLALDPGETHDLSSEAPEIAHRLLDVLHAQIKAQLEYYEGDAHLSRTHFAPRLLRCPELGATSPAQPTN